MNKFIVYIITIVIPIDFIYAGSSPAQINKSGTAIVNNQAQNQQSQSAQGAEASKTTGLNGANLANALNAAESAGAASGQQSSGSGFNMIMSGITGAMGARLMTQEDPSSKAMGAFMLLQAAQALAQSLNQGKTSKANRKSSGDLSTYDALQDPNSNTNITLKGDTTGAGGEDPSVASAPASDPKGFASSNGELSPKAQEILKKIEDAGFKVDLKDNTFTTPDGHSMSLSSASNGSAVESQLHLPPGTFAKGMSLVEDIAKRQGVANNAGEGAESYSGSGNMSEGTNSADNINGSKKNDGGLSRTPASTLVAGLTSKYKGENIGVAADDIFMMVTRRYQLKHQQDSFITPEHPEKGALVNAPKK